METLMLGTILTYLLLLRIDGKRNNRQNKRILQYKEDTRCFVGLRV